MNPESKPLTTAIARRFLNPDKAALTAAWLAFAAFAIHEISSLDIWWQVTIGADILERLEIPTIDRYSALGGGRAYHDSHWLFQVLIAMAHRFLGMIGVELVMVAILAATFSTCYGACRKWAGSFEASVLVFFAAMASVERFLPRPEIVTFLGIALVYDRVQKGKFRTATDVAILVLIQIIWSNSHGLFVIGPFLVGCHLLVTVFRKSIEPPGDVRSLVRALAAVVAATLVTPFGFGGWRYAALLLTEVGSGAPEIMRDLGELSATFGEAARSSPAFWFYLVLLILAGAAAITSLARREVSGSLMIVLAMIAASVTGRRNIVLLALVAAPFIAEQLNKSGAARFTIPAGAHWAGAALMAGYALYPLTGAYYLHMEIPARWGFGVTPSFFPHRLPSMLDEIGFEGQVLNSNTLGGFYAYHGFPERVPLTDGRWEVYGPSVIQDVVGQTRSATGWRSVVRQFEITGILIAHTSPEATVLLPELRSAPDWWLVYYDAAASFWLPGDRDGPPPEVPLDLSSLPEIPRLDDGLILNAFYLGVGAPALRAANLERSLEFGPRREFLLEQLGPLQIELGRFADAEATFTALVEEDAGHAAAHSELAFLAFRRGDLRRARDLIGRATELEPANQEFRENLERVEGAIRRNQDQGGNGL